MKRPADLSPQVPPAADGRHARSPDAARSLALARAYAEARCALWAAGADAFVALLREAARAARSDSPEAAWLRGGEAPELFEAAARSADRGCRLSRQIPGLERLVAAAVRPRNALAEANIGLAVKTCRWHRGRRGDAALSADPDDQKQAALEGLLTACDLFDAELGNAFSTYAVWWIRHAIRCEDHGSHVVDLPRDATDAYRKASDLRAKHHAETGDLIPWSAVVARLGWPASRVRVVEGVARALRAAQPVDAEDREGSVEAALVDPTAPPDEVAAGAELSRAVRAAMDVGDAGERAALAGLAGEASASVEAIARAGAVPRTAAPVIRRRAVDRAREALGPVAEAA